MKSKNVLPSYILFLVVVFLLGLMNMYGTLFTSVSLVTAIIEYIIVLYFLFQGNYIKSFVYYLAFIAVTLENNFFIYGETVDEHVRYSFLMLPFVKDYLRWALALVYFLHGYNEYREKCLTMPKHRIISKGNIAVKKWLMLLFLSGSVSVLLGLLSNDNNVMNYPDVYPKQAIISVISFVVKASLIMSAVFFTCQKKYVEIMKLYLQLIIIDIAFVSSFAAIIGFVGSYGDAVIVSSPTSLALTPVLLIFANKSINSFHSTLSLVAALLIIVISFIYGGTVVGSKWYIIIGMTLVGLIIITTKIKSLWLLSFVAIGLLMLIPLLIDPLLSIVGQNNFLSYKLSQALDVMNFFGNRNASSWYENMNNSPLQRFDELHNIFIEYTNKPWFALFGKGLGGTTRHYTTILSWNDRGNFSIEQVRMGAFFRMHESLSVLFLQHGILGLLFFIMIIKEIVIRLHKSPWSMAALIWFVFYWDYGASLAIGSIAMVLAMNENIEKPLAIYKKLILKSSI